MSPTAAKEDQVCLIIFCIHSVSFPDMQISADVCHLLHVSKIAAVPSVKLVIDFIDQFQFGIEFKFEVKELKFLLKIIPTRGEHTKIKGSQIVISRTARTAMYPELLQRLQHQQAMTTMDASDSIHKMDIYQKAVST